MNNQQLDLNNLIKKAKDKLEYINTAEDEPSTAEWWDSVNFYAKKTIELAEEVLRLQEELIKEYKIQRLDRENEAAGPTRAYVNQD